MSGWLEDRRAVVVGGGSGIGRAVVDAFQREGARVAVLDRDPQKVASICEECPEVPAVCGDASTSAANEQVVHTALEAFGGVDVLVNCVGVFDFYKGVGDLTAAELDTGFDEMFSTNVKSHLLSVKAALPALQESSGCILLTESTSAYYAGRGGVLYVASKFAVRGLVTALAHELAPRIRVNAVAPGGTVGTDLRGLDSLGLADERVDDSPERAGELAARVPLQVALSPQDHAWSYVFLGSQRSRGITGAAVHPDGGMSIKA